MFTLVLESSRKPTARFSKLSAMQMLHNKFEQKALLKEKELELKKIELELQARKLDQEEAAQKLEQEEKKRRLDLEMEERRTMLELLKKHL